MNEPYIVAVTGGRNYDNWQHVDGVLSEIHATRRIDLIVQGGAEGADDMARSWAVINAVQYAEFKVTHTQWRKTGKSAGPRRNELMLTVCRPNLLVAFPGGSGTNGCVEIAKRLGIELRDERENGLL